MATTVEVAAMRRAIAVSAAGLGGTSPNPPVGCVLLDAAGRIVGEGYHQRKGEAHAEAQALSAAGSLARDTTAVVTLEPCNHQGRTPPCRQALIDARVRRVVIAVTDPTSRGKGGTLALRAAGVDVETGVLAGEARVVLGFWLAALEAGRPAIIWPYVLSAHSMTALSPETEAARELLINADAVLHADGAVTEAVPASHGDGILRLPILAPGDDASRIAASLYEGGVRRLILGDANVAARFLAAELVDCVVAYLPDEAPSRQPDPPAPWSLLPPGFVITRVSRVIGFVRIEAHPEKRT
jgi:diaminohydroxyphosphoribosylaminopyrimidine deaminase/5-amino-6-(5-phosphoribosylamino)uracil reductase